MLFVIPVMQKDKKDIHDQQSLQQQRQPTTASIRMNPEEEKELIGKQQEIQKNYEAVWRRNFWEKYKKIYFSVQNNLKPFF